MNIFILVKNWFQIAVRFLKSHKYTSFIIALVLVIAIYFLWPSGELQYEYIHPEIKTFQTTVEGSGNVSTENSVDLVALKSGQIYSVKVKPGDKVKKGQILATISNKAQLAELTKARAEYEKVANGSAQKDIDTKQIELDNALFNLEQVKKEQETLVTNARRKFYSSDLEVKQYSGTTGTAPIITGSYNGTTTGEYRISIDGPQGYNFRVNGLERQEDGYVDDKEPWSLGTQGLMITFPDGIGYRNDDSWYLLIPNTEGENYVSNYNSYLSALSTQEKAIADAEQKIKSSQTNVAQIKAPSRYEEILSAQGVLQSAEANYEDTIIRATFDGSIGKVSVTPGEFVQVGNHAMTVVAENKIAEITLNEVDVANLAIKQPSTLTFDALPELTLTGTVTEIDTVGTDDSGVITFGVKIVVEDNDPRVKPGMSVTGTIVTKQKENVLVVPNGVLKSEDKKYYVMVKNGIAQDSPQKKHYVSIGLANDIETEIIEGITFTDEILYRTVSNKEKQTGGLIQPPEIE